MELLIWGQLSPMNFTNVWQLPEFLGWEAALLWKFIVLNSPQNFSFVTQGERWRGSLGRWIERKEERKDFALTQFEACKTGEHQLCFWQARVLILLYFLHGHYTVTFNLGSLQQLPWLWDEDDTFFPNSQGFCNNNIIYRFSKSWRNFKYQHMSYRLCNL